MSPDDQLGHLLALVRFPAFGAKRIAALLQTFPSAREAFFASSEQLTQAGIPPAVADRFVQARPAISPQRELLLLEQHHVRALTPSDAEYPALLKTIYDPPAVLFVRGAALHLPESARCLAVVGARKATRYGVQATQMLVGPLARAGVTIVSGLAYGIDACAHQAALDASGVTLAVLGAGVDDANIYPTGHRKLAKEMIEHGGALLSEFPIGTHPAKQNFPFRNRVIAGMTHATLVVEAAEKSGSLITARCALEHGRDVFAVPGPITNPLSAGPNNLLKMGATPATCPRDLLGYDAPEDKKESYRAGSALEESILKTLLGDPKHVDLIIAETGLSSQQVTSTLTLMEMKGGARHVGGMHYVRG